MAPTVPSFYLQRMPARITQNVDGTALNIRYIPLKNIDSKGKAIKLPRVKKTFTN